ncbi:hypothetical protein LPJ58_002807 [Coemansia sp. RSA 1591]|nr:hypothetical protein LPJ58_002807 [Coemansia sp. RSA 1591]
MEATQGGAWRPTPREQSAYTHLLALVDTQKDGVIRGQAAVPFFQKSGLPDATLGAIWQLADTESKGHLTALEFGVAMKLISLSQAQKPVMLGSLNEETPLPELKGIDWLQIIGSPSVTSLSGSHGRRDSNTSSIGWGSTVGGPGASLESLSEASVSAKERQQYKQIFEKSNPVDGAISGAAARSLFMKTKLNNEQLSRVWVLADPRSEGKLRLPGFIVAMYYVRRIMENRNLELPQTCPPSLWRSAGGESTVRSPIGSLSQTSLASMSTPDLIDAHWDVTKEERQRYEQFFISLDPKRTGYLTGDVPVNFFLKSKLPESDLSRVWDLADITRSGKLSKDEFAVAMHLINAQLAGVRIPDKLPPTLVPPSMRKASIVSSSMHNLSPTLRPISTKDRLLLSENLKRSTSYVPSARGTVPSTMSRSSTNRSTAALSQTDDSSLAMLQSQVGQMEDFSRGLQTQRTATASQLAVTSTRKQELEGRLAALQSSHEVELRINQELQEKLKSEETQVELQQAQVAEANRQLSVAAAQHNQLEQYVHRVQAQQVALNQRLQQAQDDNRQLNTEIAELEQQKTQMEEALVVAQDQIKQRQLQNQELAEKVAALKSDMSALTQMVSDAEATAGTLATKLQAQLQTQAELQAQSQAKSQPQSQAKSQPQLQLQPTTQEGLSFDDIFGTGGDSQPMTAEGGGFSSSGEFISARTDNNGSSPLANYPESSTSVASIAGSLPGRMPHSQPPAMTAFATMPSLELSVGSSAHAASTDAFDSFGAHSSDPFEEFMQSAGAPKEKPVDDQSFDAMFAPAVTRSQTKPVEAAVRAMSDPRSVTSTPAPSNRATPSIGPGMTKSTPSSPPLKAASTGQSGELSATSGQGFAADFTTAFGLMPSTGAINQDIEAFETKFPDVGSLEISNDVAKRADDGQELTFESVFGSGDDLNNAQTGAKSAAPASAPAPARAPSSGNTSEAKDSDSKTDTITTADKSSADDTYDDDFVPPPVVKRTNVSARPMSRVLSIFRSNPRGGLLSTGPTLPKRSATDKRQQLLKEQDKKFEEKWAKGDWPEWVKKGEYFYERKMLLEMGYSKDRVVEALEVNDFNLAQATDYLISS